MNIKTLLIGFIIVISSASLWACNFDQSMEKLRTRVQDSRLILDRKLLDNVDVVKQHLAIMIDLEQGARKLLMQNVNNEGVRTLIKEIDSFHTDYLKDILKLHQWITISKFGEKADHDAWLLVQHSDHDPDFQRSYLVILEKLWPLQETNVKNYAYLYDRVALKSNLPQRYGTQAKIENNQVELLPLEGSMDDVNKRRTKMGFEPLEHYLEALKKAYVKTTPIQP